MLKLTILLTSLNATASPVVENVELARSLFFEVERGDKIPETLFEPVAALLRMVMKIDYAHSTETP
ncbi:secretion system apparatus protein SsaU [Salmonella enterica subsp. enterica]|nr:secretion system apparatus protein SsaU [Salmonella enterica subsp. enterica]